jgi:hypothetical protein
MKDGNIVLRVSTKARDSSVNQSEKRGSRIHPVPYATSNEIDSPEVKMEPETDLSPISSEEDENKWSYYYALPYAFMACRATNIF